MNAEVSPFKDDWWVERGSSKLLMYIGPTLKKNLELQTVKKFVREKGVWGATWNYDYDYGEEGLWYNYVCDMVDYDIDKIKSKKARYQVRRGLKNCTVRQIDYLWLADNGYEVYVKASSRYSSFKPEPKKKFREQMRSHSRVPGREAFGAFIDERLVAYIMPFICGHRVFVYASGFDPAYSKAYPMYALYYTIAHHYLKEKGYKEIDNGSRPLLHETSVGDFRLHLGWRKAYCRLELYLVWPLRAALSIARIFRKASKTMLPSQYYAILDGLFLAQDMVKTTSAKTNCI